MTEENKRTRRAEPITRRKAKNGRVSYEFRADVGVKPDGSRDRRRFTYPTKKEAQAEYRRITTEVAAGRYVGRSRVTVAEHVEAWLAGKRDVRPNTLRNYTDAAKPIVRDLGGLELQRLTKAHIDKFLGGLTRRDGRPYSTDSARLVLAVLRQVTKDAHRQGIISRDPSEFVEPPKAKRVAAENLDVWTREEANLFRKHTAEDRMAACWLLTLCGLRRSEVLGLRWRDVDLDAGTITVTQGRVEVTATFIDTAEPKTARGRRALPISGEIIDALAALRRLQAAERAEMGCDYAETGLVAVEPDGTPTLPRTYSDRFRRLASAAGVPPITLRNVRHTSVSVMLDAGVPPTVVAAWHGHDPRMTVSVYGRTYDDSLKTAGAAMFGTPA
ncbi:site-specific integrase [Gordonia neofelifaecis]|uniref:Phage integrase family protein n=1 Tax=Gordonia neofelifaecis NRRL B-59395 TaxID=644548 RepID=F1YE92_9ACTN|nr:tyrosine-type recombinase/integrase [Gordonia neofelifaecis]EGD56725.1 phage integrase family protein [Gordonia neofelifaecis NRRL B-59395]